MFVVISKVGWFLAQPIAVILILAICAYTTVGYLMIGALEQRPLDELLQRRYERLRGYGAYEAA